MLHGFTELLFSYWCATSGGIGEFREWNINLAVQSWSLFLTFFIFIFWSKSFQTSRNRSALLAAVVVSSPVEVVSSTLAKSSIGPTFFRLYAIVFPQVVVKSEPKPAWLK